jgi:DNA-binding GntR family transcriptional regulator
MGDTMLKRENISDKLADAIEKKIIHNELKSGEIITEAQISKEWNISRSPVRDALHILKNKWLLEKSSKGQYMVPVLNADYVENSYDAWIMFYQYTCSRATKYITDKDSAYLLSVVEKIEKSIGYGDFDIYVQETSKFMRKVIQIARNPIIERSASELMPTAQRIQFAAYEIEPSYPEKGIKHLWECYECLSGKDSDNAAKSMGLLANVSKEIIVNHFKGLKQKVNQTD